MKKKTPPLSKKEDENPLIGFGKHGGKWSIIQKDEELGLAHRRSTDLRDRFRNAFPEKYVGAGFKPPPVKRRRRNDETQESMQPTFNIHHMTNTSMPTGQMQLGDATMLTPMRREQLAVAVNSQLTSDTFSHTHIPWTNHHSVTAQQEREMA